MIRTDGRIELVQILWAHKEVMETMSKGVVWTRILNEHWVHVSVIELLMRLNIRNKPRKLWKCGDWVRLGDRRVEQGEAL